MYVYNVKNGPPHKFKKERRTSRRRGHRTRILRVALNGIERGITRVANKRKWREWGAGGGRGPIWLRGDGLKVLNEKQLGRHALRFSRFAVFAAEIERIRVMGGIEQS